MDKKLQKEIKSEKEQVKKSTRILNIILAVVLAIILWAYVLGEVNPETKITLNGVPLTVTGEAALEDEGLVILTDIEDSVTAVVEGRRSEIYSLSAANLTARIDVSQLEEGENQVEILVTAPGNADDAYAKEGNLIIVVDRYTEETEPITVEVKGSLNAGNDVKVTSMSEENVTMSGPSTYLAKVDCVKGILHVNSTENTIISEIEINPYDKDGRIVKGVELSVNTIKVDAVRSETKAVPVEVELTGTAASGTAVSLDGNLTLKITGDAEDVDEITGLTAEPVDISGIEEDTTVQVAVTVPPGVKALNSVGNVIEKDSSGKVMIEAILRVTSEDQEQKEE